MKFLNEVKQEGISITPSFIKSNINTEDIIKGTTGNKVMDIALDTAINYSKKLDRMKADNEIAKSQIDLNNELKEYELSWQKKDKYSDENYNEYKTGLEAIYGRARSNFANTQYTTEADVLNWENKINQDTANSIYLQDGEKANYDIKKVVDETTTNVNSLLSEYSASGDESIKLKALEMFSNLKDIGIPEHEIEQKKISLLVKSDTDKLQMDINKIINDPNLSLEDKRNRINLMRDNMSKGEMYKIYADESFKNKYISKDSVQALESYSKAIYQDMFLKAGGLIDQYNRMIENERDRAEAKRLQKENNYLKELTKEIDDFQQNKTGRDLGKGLSALLGQKVNGEELIKNPGLLYQFTNFKENDYVDYENSNLYVPIINQSGVRDINDRITTNQDPNMYGDLKYNEINALHSTLDIEDNDYQRSKKYINDQLINETSIERGDIAIYNSFNNSMRNGNNLAQEYMSDYNRTDKISFNVNSVNPSSRDYKKYKEIFKGADSNTQMITLNIIQGQIEKGRYTSDGIYAGDKINSATINSVLNSSSVQKEIQIIVDGLKGNTNFKASSPVMITTSNKDGEKIIKSRLRFKHSM